MAGERAGSEALPVLPIPAVGMNERPERKGRVRYAPGHDDLGAFIECACDRLGSQIDVRRNDVRTWVQHLTIHLAGGELFRREETVHIVAFDHRDAQAWETCRAGQGRNSLARRRGLAAPKFPIMRMPFSRQGPRAPGNMRSKAGL